MHAEEGRRQRVALVLSGGGARGAYEAGVLSHLFEHVYPKLGPDFEFDIISGTSVGAIHAAYVAASSGLPPAERARRLIQTWEQMRFDTVLRLSWRDILGIPLRAMGLSTLRAKNGPGDKPGSFGGIVDVTPLEALVRERVPWERLPANLASGRPGVLCVAATEITTGSVQLFFDGPQVDTTPWEFDTHVNATNVTITEAHVRASAAIPFLFPAVRIGDCYMVDGGLRLNTPLSPALRMGADKVLVVGVRHDGDNSAAAPCRPEALTQPAFVLGKLLDVVLLDPIQAELRHVEVLNALLAGGREAFGDEFQAKIAPYVEAKRGIPYREVTTKVVQPSLDVGHLAAQCYQSRPTGRRDRSLIASLLERSATFGVPEQEADLLSYIYFDAAYTGELVELGREDARRQEDDILQALSQPDD